jgi:hypothetical protein
LVTELGEASDRLLDPDLGRAAIEVVGAEVVVRGADFEQSAQRPARAAEGNLRHRRHAPDGNLSHAKRPTSR